MKPIQPEGTQAETDIELVSITRNPETGETREDEGWLCFTELLIFHDDLYIATVRCHRLNIRFGDYSIIDLNPKLTSSRSDTNYHRIRAWIAKAENEIAARLLKEMPHVRAVNPLTHKPDSPTDFEDEMAGYQLFADMCDVKTSELPK